MALHVHHHRGKELCDAVSHLDMCLLATLLIPLPLKEGGILSTKVCKRLHRDNSLVNCLALSYKYTEMTDGD